MTSTQREIIQRIKELVREEFLSAEASHDWQHVMRVENNALALLSKTPEANKFIVLLAVYLHDLADAKFHNGDEHIGPKRTQSILKEHQVSDDVVKEVTHIVAYMSFRSSFQEVQKSINFQLVQDADRLDALGAVGIARAFQYGGYKNRKLYSNLPPKNIQSGSDYKNSESATIQHFFEKLLKLKDLMNTDAGKQEANVRHEFMLTYLNQFYRETDAPNWLQDLLLKQ